MVDLYFREHNIFILLMVIQSYIIPGAHRLLIIHSRGDEIPQNLNNFLESKCLDETKRERFAAVRYFDISIVGNLCLLQQYKWSIIKIQLPRLIFNAPYGSNDFFISP